MWNRTTFLRLSREFSREIMWTKQEKRVSVSKSLEVYKRKKNEGGFPKSLAIGRKLIKFNFKFYSEHFFGSEYFMSKTGTFRKLLRLTIENCIIDIKVQNTVHRTEETYQFWLYSQSTKSGNGHFLAHILSWWKKLAQAGEDGGFTPTPFTISTITYKFVV